MLLNHCIQEVIQSSKCVRCTFCFFTYQFVRAWFWSSFADQDRSSIGRWVKITGSTFLPSARASWLEMHICIINIGKKNNLLKTGDWHERRRNWGSRKQKLLQQLHGSETLFLQILIDASILEVVGSSMLREEKPVIFHLGLQVGDITGLKQGLQAGKDGTFAQILNSKTSNALCKQFFVMAFHGHHCSSVYQMLMG